MFRSWSTTGRELSVDEEEQLRRPCQSIVLKGVRSPERLLDETALFLHRVVADLPHNKRRMLRELHEKPEALAGRKVMVVDDDVRNIFALSSVLRRHGMRVVIATTGREAINVLEQTPDVVTGIDGHHRCREWTATKAMRRHSRSAAIPSAADHRSHCQGHEGRSRESAWRPGRPITLPSR